jgi:uncharacterized protein (TIGR00251 family)
MAFKFYIQPGAKKTEIKGEFNGMLKIKISAPPVEGAANKELINFLSKKLKIKKSEIKIKNGQNSRIKTIEIPMDKDNLYKLLNE